MRTLGGVVWWVLGALAISWALDAFTFREQPGTMEAERPEPEGPWVMRYTDRYRRLWASRALVLAVALGAGWYLGVIMPIVDGGLNAHDTVFAFLLAVALAEALAATGNGYRGSIELRDRGILVRRAFSSVVVPWNQIRLVKRFYALDGWAVLRRDKPPVFLSAEMHGLGRFVRELLDHAPQAAKASNLSRFPAPVVGATSRSV